jgi:signal transduction histidine kinase
VPLYHAQREKQQADAARQRLDAREAVRALADDVATHAASHIPASPRPLRGSSPPCPTTRARRTARTDVAAIRRLRRSLASIASLQALTESTVAAMRARDPDDDLARVVIVDANCRRVADSALGAAPTRFPVFPRDELAAALVGQRLTTRRRSNELEANIELTVAPSHRNRHVVGAVRVTRTASAGSPQGGGVPVALVTGIVGLMAMGVAVLLSRPLVNQLRGLEATVRRISGGDLTARAPLIGSREQRLVSRALNDMAAQLQRLLSNQEAFVANASHELRTPLTGMRLRLELLRRRLADDRRGRHHVEEALREVDRLSSIVEELMQLSRAHEPARDGNDLDLNKVTWWVTTRWQPTAQERHIALRIHTPEEPCLAICAVDDLERALEILIENALAYSPEGSSVDVTTGLGHIEVADRGPGLAEGEEEAVFERFQRGKAGRGGPKGSGLGLAIARELMERWNGTARISNRHGGGATATLELPPAGAAQPSPSGFTYA